MPVVNRMVKPWQVLAGATFTRNDPQYAAWAARREGVYTTNGALLSVVQRSAVGKPVPDLFCYAVLADFRGYQPGYSERDTGAPRLPDVGRAQGPHQQSRRVGDHHVSRSAGAAGDRLPLLRGRDATPPATISGGVIAGIRLVRRLTAGMKPRLIAEEELPGDASDERRGAEAVRSRSRLGASRVVHLRHRARGGRRRAHDATSRCTGPSACAWWMRRSSPARPACSSSRRST